MFFPARLPRPADFLVVVFLEPRPDLLVAADKNRHRCAQKVIWLEH